MAWYTGKYGTIPSVAYRLFLSDDPIHDVLRCRSNATARGTIHNYSDGDMIVRQSLFST